MSKAFIIFSAMTIEIFLFPFFYIRNVVSVYIGNIRQILNRKTFFFSEIFNFIPKFFFYIHQRLKLC